MRTHPVNINADFTCKYCGRFVSANTALSGVVHRNHCPYCLHSRHVDLFKAGDRLCACKSLMAPVGLTLKHSRDKYARRRGGELMLVHRCTHCGDLVINRIAADDDPGMLIKMVVDTAGQRDLAKQCQMQDIKILGQDDLPLLNKRLFGRARPENQKTQYQF